MQKKCLHLGCSIWSTVMQFNRVTGYEFYDGGIYSCLKLLTEEITWLSFLAQHASLLPPQIADQLLWSRFVNTHRVCGRNTPCDFHLEHLNHLLKNAIQNLGANKTERAVVRVGRCIGPFMTLWDKINTVPVTADQHHLEGLHLPKAMVAVRFSKWWGQGSIGFYNFLANRWMNFHWYTSQQCITLVSLGAPGGSLTFLPASCKKAGRVVHLHLDADSTLTPYPYACVSLLTAPWVE